MAFVGKQPGQTALAAQQPGPTALVTLQSGQTRLGKAPPNKEIPVYKRGRSLSMSARADSQEIGTRIGNKRSPALRTGTDRLTICASVPAHPKQLLQQADRVSKYHPSGNSSSKDTSKQRASVRSNRKYATENQHYHYINVPNIISYKPVKSKIPSAVGRATAARNLSPESRSLGETLRVTLRDQYQQQQHGQDKSASIARSSFACDKRAVPLHQLDATGGIRPATSVMQTSVGQMRSVVRSTVGIATTTTVAAAPLPDTTGCDVNGNATANADKRYKRTLSSNKLEKNIEKVRKLRLKQPLKENSPDISYECTPMVVLLKKLTLGELIEANVQLPPDF